MKESFCAELPHVYRLSVRSVFCFLAEKETGTFIKHLPHGRCSTECFVYIISLNPHGNPMRKAVLSPFYSSGNPSSGGISNLPWVTQPLDGLWPWVCPIAKHSALSQNIPPSTLWNSYPTFSFYYGIFTLFVDFHFELCKSLISVLSVRFTFLLLILRHFHLWADNFFPYGKILIILSLWKYISRVIVI